MKTFTIPYGSGEWDAAIDVELTDEEAALLEASMAKEEFFHMDEDPDLSDIELKVSKLIFEENKKQMIADGRMEEAREFNPGADDDDLVDEELGSYHICMPNAFDWM